MALTDLGEITKLGECPYTINSEELTFNGRWLGLRQVHFIDPKTKQKGVWQVAFRTTKPASANADGIDIIPILKTHGGTRKSLILVKQYRIPIKGWSLEFPAGLVDAGESMEAAALRELKEETGYTATKKRSKGNSTLAEEVERVKTQLNSVEDQVRRKTLRAYGFDFKPKDILPVVSIGKVLVAAGIFTQEKWDNMEWDGTAPSCARRARESLRADKEKILKSSKELEGRTNPDDRSENKPRIVFKERRVMAPYTDLFTNIEDMSVSSSKERTAAMKIRFQLMCLGWRVKVLGRSHMLEWNGTRKRAHEIDVLKIDPFNPTLHKADFGIPKEKMDRMVQMQKESLAKEAASGK